VLSKQIRKVILVIASMKLVLFLLINLPSKGFFRSKLEEMLVVGKRCFVHSRLADVFQVVISVGVVLTSVRAGVQVAGSLLNSSWSNLPFALINLSLRFQIGSCYTSSVTLLNCYLVCY